MILTYASERNQSALPINVHIYKNRDSSNYIESAFTEEKPRTAIHHCSTIVPLWKRWGGEGAKLIGKEESNEERNW